MSMHSSLKAGDGLSKQKSVMTRSERIKLLQANKNWTETSTVTNLPKIKVLKVKTGKKKG